MNVTNSGSTRWYLGTYVTDERQLSGSAIRRCRHSRSNFAPIKLVKEPSSKAQRISWFFKAKRAIFRGSAESPQICLRLSSVFRARLDQELAEISHT